MREIDLSWQQSFPQVVEWRRFLHQHPELSYHEKQTAAFIADKLTAWGLDVQTGVGGGGVVGRLVGGQPGPVVALRADMDALPIQDEKRCEYSSKVQGVMHACGHDGHTATLLGVAKTMSEMRDELRGQIVFLFQHAEETAPGGARAMIEDGALEGVDVIYGVHLWTPFPVGEIRTSPGPMMAAADEFVIKIQGKGGHGGLPHETVDSIYIGAQLVVNLQAIVSRETDPFEPAVVTIGSFHGGSSSNIIAANTIVKGTVRTFSEAHRQTVRQRLEEVADATCRMYGAIGSVDYRWGYPPVINDEEAANTVIQTAKDRFGAERASVCAPVMAAEDFAYYLQHVPGCFIFIGAGNRERGIVYPHHHPMFDIDESSMDTAGKLLIQLAIQYADGQKRD